MTYVFKPAIRSVAAAALLSAALTAGPAVAQTTTAPSSTDQPTTQAPAATKAPRAHRSPVDHVEARITDLHKKLGITQAQQPQWDALTQVMRDNAKAEQALGTERTKTEATGSAVDNLHSYETIIDTRAEGLKKFVPAFEALYNTMSDDQKKTADTLFQHHPHKARAKKS